MLSVGMIVGGAFRLLRERPASVLVWGAIYSLAAFVFGYFMMSSMAPMTAIGGNANPNQALSAMAGAFGELILLELAFFCVYTVLQTAAQRAVLRPEETAFASIRFGGDELRMIGLAIFLAVLFFIGYVVFALILGIVLAVVLAGAGAGASGTAFMATVAIVTALLLISLVMFFWVRVSLAFPLTLMRGRFVLGEAWRLSRGRFWTLLGGYGVLLLIIVAIVLVGSLVMNGSYWSQLIGGGLATPAAQQAARAQMAAQYTLGLPMILALLFGTIVGGLAIAFSGGSVATAARALASDQQGVAQTFA